MPSLRSNKNLRALLPYPVTAERVCIGVSVPNDPRWIAAFYGQLQRLSLQSIWDRDTAHTAKQIAAVWWQVYLDTLAGNCMGECDDCLERIVADPATGRLGFFPDGSIDFYRFPDGPWVEGYPDPTWPAPQPYTDGTDDERRCIASRNAAMALRMLYQQTWEVFIDQSVDTVLKLSSSVLAAFASLLAVTFGINILLEIAQDLLNNAAAFTDPFPDEDFEAVQCILFCNSSVDGEGTVTFDFAAVVSEFGAQGTDPFGGLNFLLQLYLGEEGLNAAGGIHNLDPADCSECDCFPTWCYKFDFSVDNGGWFSPQANSGVYASGVGWQGQTFNANNNKYLEIRRNFSAATITRFYVRYTKAGGSGGNNVNQVVLYPDGGGSTVVLVNEAGGIGTNVNYDETGDWPNIVGAAIAFNAGNSGAAITAFEIILEGEGMNPFGVDNC